MTDPVNINTAAIPAVLATVIPFFAFVIILVGMRKRPRLSAGISIGAISVSLLTSIYLLVRLWEANEALEYTRTWLISGSISIPVGVYLDSLSLLMLTIVTGICFLVQVYSLGYMAGDPGFSRYYAFMSLFAWAMASMTVAPTMLQLYVFWELVGLASYLLIGFWFEKWSASTAGKKAFVMTRLGDVAFFLGLLLVLLHLGNLSIPEMNGLTSGGAMSSGMITLSAVLIFGGVIGKSAQFPLLTWLPDAMEGPTPVSALLHSATMVAAGVYMFARIFPFFTLSPSAMNFCLFIGTLSMLLASTMAMVSRDIKQVWAFSTISQLGFMIMGLAAGGYFSGVFHLTTHAGFKALLFLCSGVFIHAYGTNDMFDIGKAGGRGLKAPMICMTIAAAALSGLPPFSGFYSKEAIMGTLAEKGNPVWLLAGLVGAFLTAYYSFRLIFIILFPGSGNQEGGHEPQEHGSHAHGFHYRIMVIPLLILAGVTLVLGFGEHGIKKFILRSIAGAPEIGHHAWLPFVAIPVTLAGIFLAWVEFGKKGAKQVGFVERVPELRELFAERWYLDRFYRWFLDRIIYKGFSATFTANDRKVIDGGVDGLGRLTVIAGRFIAALHTGSFQGRMTVMFVVIFLVSLYFIF